MEHVSLALHMVIIHILWEEEKKFSEIYARENKDTPTPFVPTKGLKYEKGEEERKMRTNKSCSP